MRHIWSDQTRFTTWRKLWLALAEGQRELGLDISEAQIRELRDNLSDIDYAKAAEYETKLRHDVMAHIHALGDVAPAARPIIHLGATSQFVNCNTELLQMRDSLRLIATKLAAVIIALGKFANTHRDLPTLAFTHFQPAQPTTVGKRAAGWAADLALALEDIEFRLDKLRFRGIKGTTGTQASFMALFDGDTDKVERLDELITEKMLWRLDRRYTITGQTYPRIVDAHMLGSLAATAAGLHKIATDIRLLAGKKEIEEPFESEQVGSSAMPYKRNPMRCERICGMARFVMNLAGNALDTAATQWLERTLDDSANRRLAIPQAFLALDGVLDLMRNVAEGLVVNEAVIRANLMSELPFMATENLLMAAVRAGADRQKAHEVIRLHSLAAGQAIKSRGGVNDLLQRLQSEPMFRNVDFEAATDPAAFVGRAADLVEKFLATIVAGIQSRYGAALSELNAASIRV